MSWTKRELIEQSFDEAGLASYVPNLTPTQLQSALKKLDNMMGTWFDDGIDTGYPLVATPSESDLDTLTTMSVGENEVVIKNLSIRIAPSLGKTLSNDTQKIARQAYTTLLSKYTRPVAVTLPDTLTRGQGSKYWRNTDDPFFDETTTTTTIEVI